MDEQLKSLLSQLQSINDLQTELFQKLIAKHGDAEIGPVDMVRQLLLWQGVQASLMFVLASRSGGGQTSHIPMPWLDSPN